MSALACFMFRSQRICSIPGSPLLKRCSFSVWNIDGHVIKLPRNVKRTDYTLPRRTILKKRELVGSDKSVTLKSAYKRDKVGQEFNFVYSIGDAKIYLWFLPAGLVLVSTLIVLSAVVIFQKFNSNEPLEKTPVNIAHLEDMISPLDAALFVLPLATVVLISMVYLYKSVLLRLYYNPSNNEFIAVMLRYGIFRQKVHFRESDVQRLGSIKLHGNILIKGLPVRLSEETFKDIGAYNLLMGYNSDRPSEYAVKQRNENIRFIMEKVAEKQKQKKSDTFVEKYMEKRNRRQNQKKDD